MLSNGHGNRELQQRCFLVGQPIEYGHHKQYWGVHRLCCGHSHRHSDKHAGFDKIRDGECDRHSNFQHHLCYRYLLTQLDNYGADIELFRNRSGNGRIQFLCHLDGNRRHDHILWRIYALIHRHSHDCGDILARHYNIR